MLLHACAVVLHVCSGCMYSSSGSRAAHHQGEDDEAGHADLEGALKGLQVPAAPAVHEVPAHPLS